MKTSILYLIFLTQSCFIGYSQQVINNTKTEKNEAIQQIRKPSNDNVLIFQTLNQAESNYAFSQQIGNQNMANISQKSDAGSYAANQAYNYQLGNSNEMTVGQIGSGNMFTSFQLGYATTELGKLKENQYGFGLDKGNGNFYAYDHGNSDLNSAVVGERNKLTIDQKGTGNSVMAVQQGTGNTISAEQSGLNNCLLLYQRGKNNTISDYKQENDTEKILFDVVIQQGESLSLSTTDASKSKQNGNTYIQEGVNLSLQVNNEFANALGGVEINQTGKDMKVVVDQSYFSFPMK